MKRGPGKVLSRFRRNSNYFQVGWVVVVMVGCLRVKVGEGMLTKTGNISGAKLTKAKTARFKARKFSFSN